MKTRARFRAAVATVLVALAPAAFADDPALERAKQMLASGNAKGAYEELVPVQDRLSGMPEFDYVFGVAALDSGHIDEAIIAFERVLALVPNHAGAQMDLARAYYAAGSYDLAEAAFLRLRSENPPPAAQEAIARYLDAIAARKRQTQPGWTAFGELGIGYDSNITGVPNDFGAAALQSFNLAGFEPTGNSVKRAAAFVQGAAGAEYSYPLSRGWSLFAGGEARGRAYHKETDFNLVSLEGHFGGALNEGVNQYRATLGYSPYWQEGAAPGEPKITNDRRIGGLNLDWKHSIDTKTQAGIGVQLNAIRFPDNKFEDFDQVLFSASYLKAFERPGVPLVYLTGFVTDDKAKVDFDDGAGGTTNKSKNLYGARSYVQYSLAPKVEIFNGLALIVRRDKEAFARSTTVEKGRDVYGEILLGGSWRFRDACALRLQYVFSRNSSNIDIYDFNRHEVSSNIRCDML